jgi:hypothetical protein
MYDGKQVRIYYHCFLTEDKTWVFTLLDQFNMLKWSGLLDVVDYFPVFVGGSKKQIDLFKQFALVCPKITIAKEMIVNTTNEDIRTGQHNHFDNENIFSERQTMNQIWLDSQEKDFYFLYLQTKSVTSFALNIDSDIKNVQRFSFDFTARKLMEENNINRWKECIDKLEDYNMVGCFLSDDRCNLHDSSLDELSEDKIDKENYDLDNRQYLPRGYRGNIFWSKSSHIRKLNSIMDNTWWDKEKKKNTYSIPDRWIAEVWPMSYEDSIENYFNFKEERLEKIYKRTINSNSENL